MMDFEKIFDEEKIFYKNRIETLCRNLRMHIPEHTRSLSGGLLGHKIMP